MPEPPMTDHDAIRQARARAADVGAAEHRAMQAETDALAGGASESDLEAFTAETLGAAGCQEYLDALRLLSWRARGLSRALELVNIGGPRGTEDAMMHPIVVTAAALANLVSSSFTIRDSNSENSARDEAAACWRWAIKELTRLTGNEPVELAVAPKHAE